jgi:hypothetical protein
VQAFAKFYNYKTQQHCTDLKNENKSYWNHYPWTAPLFSVINGIEQANEHGQCDHLPDDFEKEVLNMEMEWKYDGFIMSLSKKPNLEGIFTILPKWSIKECL